MATARSRFTAGIFLLGASMVLLFDGRAAAGEPVKVQAAQRAFTDAYRQEDWDRAVDVGLDLARMQPNDATTQYNLACVYALSGDSDASLHWLGRAAASGFNKVALVDNDPDLDGVRDRPGYSRVRSAIEANQCGHKNDLDGRAAASPVLIVTPDGFDDSKPAPLVVVFHGYGDRARNYPRFWNRPAEELNAIVAVPQGLRTVGNGFGWGSVDEADAILKHTLSEVDRRYRIDRDRIILAGFSQGGYIALALGTRHPETIAGVIPMAGPYIPDVDAPPPAESGDPRYYFIVGARDRAARDMRRAARDFEDAGFEVRLRVVPGIGHGFPEAGDRELLSALRWVLE